MNSSSEQLKPLIKQVREHFVLHTIFSLSLPSKILIKCVTYTSEELQRPIIHSEAIDSLLECYLSKQPKNEVSDKGIVRFAPIKKIVEDYLNESSKGFEIPKTLDSEQDVQKVNDLIAKHIPDSEMLGLLLWRFINHPAVEIQNLVDWLLLDARLIKGLADDLKEASQKASQKEYLETRVTKLEQKLTEKEQSILKIEQVNQSLLRQQNQKQTIEIPQNDNKYSQVKKENKSLQDQISQLRTKIKTLEKDQETHITLGSLSENLNTKITQIRKTLPEIIEHFSKVKSQTQIIKPIILGLQKFITLQQPQTLNTKSTIDIFIDSYDLCKSLPKNKIIDFDLLKLWLKTFFNDYDLGNLTVFVYLSGRRGDLIQAAKKSGFAVEFLSSASWISSLTCRILESKASATCLIAGNEQFIGLTRFLERKNQKIYFVFSEDHISDRLKNADFIPLKHKDFVRSF